MIAVRQARLGGARPGTAALAGTVVASLALAGAVGTSLILAAGASGQRLLFFVPASRSGFPDWMHGPLSQLGLTLTPAAGAWLLVVLCACYVLTLVNAPSIGLGSAVVAIGCAHLAFALAAPLYSADIFGYIDYARLFVLHGIDPYAHGAAAAPHDAVAPYVRWHDVGSPYGPLFTIASLPLAWLDVPTAFWTLKALAGAASLSGVALVARIARQLGRPVVPAVLFVGLNPVLLAYGVGGGHNDFFALVVMLGAVTLALGERDAAAAGFVIAAALKPPMGIALAFLLIARRSRRGLVTAVVAIVAVAGLALLVFGTGAVAVVGQIAHQQHLVAGLSVPGVVSNLIGLQGVPSWMRTIAGLALVTGVGLLAWRTWHGGDWLQATGWAALALLVTSAWLLPWYVVWVLPFAAVAGSARLRTASLSLTLFIVVTHVAPYLSR